MATNFIYNIQRKLKCLLFHLHYGGKGFPPDSVSHYCHYELSMPVVDHCKSDSLIFSVLH